MDEWHGIAERKIREAMEEGAFDKLEGKGRPLDLSENPFEDPSLRMAHRLLRNNGFAPPWVEERKELERDICFARDEFGRTRNRELWRQCIRDFNRRIFNHNLKTASPGLHLQLLSSEEE
jgi:hypothetical protein